MVTKSPANLTLFRCHQDIFSLGTAQNNQFSDETDERIWQKGYKTDYMVVGPVQSKEHLSTCE